MTHRPMPCSAAFVFIPLIASLVAAWPAVGQVPAPGGTATVDANAFKADEPGTFATADLSYVMTSGNARAATLGFKGDLAQRWAKHALSFGAAGVQSSSSTGLNYAQGSPASFSVVRPDPEKTVEYYNLRGRYDYRLTQAFFYTLGANWERNLFSGVRSRLIGETGFGYVFVASEETDFRTRIGVTYTHNDPVIENPDVESDFVGVRLGWSLRQRLTPNTTLTHDLVADENLQNTDDFRADAGLGLNVAMSSTLALKANYRLLYSNLPALETIPLLDPTAAQIGTVTTPLRKVDQGVSISLVLNWSKKAA